MDLREHHKECGHPDSSKNKKYCFSCVADQLCADGLLAVQVQRILQRLKQNIVATFPSTRTKTKLQLWSAVLPGIIAAAGQNGCLQLVCIFDAATKGFSASELIDFVLPPMLFSFEPSTHAAELVIQIITYVVQQYGPSEKSKICQGAVLVRFVCNSIVAGTDPTKEAALFLTWLLLLSWNTDNTEYYDSTSNFETNEGDCCLRQEIFRCLEEHPSTVAGLLAPKMPVQLQMNAVGLLTQLVSHSEADSWSHEDISDALFAMDKCLILRALLLSMVQAPPEVAVAATILLTKIFSAQQDVQNAFFECGVLDYISESLQNPQSDHHFFTLELLVKIVGFRCSSMNLPHALLAFKIVTEFLDRQVDELPWVSLAVSSHALALCLDVVNELNPATTSISHPDKSAVGQHDRAATIDIDKVLNVDERILTRIDHELLSVPMYDEQREQHSIIIVNELMQSLYVSIAHASNLAQSINNVSASVEKISQCFATGVCIIRSALDRSPTLEASTLLSSVPNVFKTATELARFTDNTGVFKEIEWLVLQVLDSLPNVVDDPSMIAATFWTLLQSYLETSKSRQGTFSVHDVVEPLLKAHTKAHDSLRQQIAVLLWALCEAGGYIGASALYLESVKTVVLNASLEGSVASFALQARMISSQRQTLGEAATTTSLHLLCALLCAKLSGMAIELVGSKKLSHKEANYILAVADIVLVSARDCATDGQNTARQTNNILQLCWYVLQTSHHTLGANQTRMIKDVVASAQQTWKEGSDESTELSSVLIVAVGLETVQRGDPTLANTLYRTLCSLDQHDVDEVAQNIARTSHFLQVLGGWLDFVIGASTSSDAKHEDWARCLKLCTVVISRHEARSFAHADADFFLMLLHRKISFFRAIRNFDAMVSALAAVEQIILQQRRVYNCPPLLLEVMQVLSEHNMFDTAMSRSLMTMEHRVKCLDFLTSAMIVFAEEKDMDFSGSSAIYARDGDASTSSRLQHFVVQLTRNQLINTFFFPQLGKMIFSCPSSCLPVAEAALVCSVAFSCVIVCCCRGTSKRSANQAVLLSLKRIISIMPSLRTEEYLRRLLQPTGTHTQKLCAMHLVRLYVEMGKLPGPCSVVQGQLTTQQLFSRVIRFSQTVFIDERSPFLHKAAIQLMYVLFAVSSTAFQSLPPKSPEVKSSSDEQLGSVDDANELLRLSPERDAWSDQEIMTILFGNVWFEFVLQQLLGFCMKCLTWSTFSLQFLTMYIVATKDGSICTCPVELTHSVQLSIFESLKVLVRELVTTKQTKQFQQAKGIQDSIFAHMMVFVMIFNSPEYTPLLEFQDHVTGWMARNECLLLGNISPHEQKASKILPPEDRIGRNLLHSVCQRWPPSTTILFRARHIFSDRCSDALAGGSHSPPTTPLDAHTKRIHEEAAKRATKTQQLLQCLADPKTVLVQFLKSSFAQRRSSNQ